jgi:hypothetical protein
MSTRRPLRVVLVKPSKYAVDGFVERFRWGFMPNSTLPYLRSMVPESQDGRPCHVHAVDEYVQADLEYLQLLRREPGCRTLLALVGVQSHQFHRALDLAAFARERGVEGVVIGGPHPMTCDTSEFQGRGVSFALAEAELIWPTILRHAADGELLPVYGADQRWQERLDPPVLVPPTRRDLRRYAASMMGVYPARGCPFTCNFCSVIKIAGRQVRSQPVETTLASLRAARSAGVGTIMFTSDNFNKYAEAMELLDGMIREDLRFPFFAQCDTQVAAQEELVARMAQAGCYQIFVGVESFSREALLSARKLQNHPERYGQIVELCRAHGITSHFSNILGFPDDTEAGVVDHLEVLRRLGPDVVSFYVLTPIPGTEQYDDYLGRGLITEPNLDRFDGTCVTWGHPRMGRELLQDLMFRCYRKFYRWKEVAARAARQLARFRDLRTSASLNAILGYPLLSQMAARMRRHPMAGGTWRVRIDRAEDYATLRRRRYGTARAQLPASLVLSARDREINRRARLDVLPG